jgi:HTH-type transcriptional regulator, competence development regulator
MKKTFGNILKELRRNKGISQRELADKIGVDFSYISKVENDRLPPPAGDTIVKICKELNIPTEILLAESGKVSSNITELIGSSQQAIKFMLEASDMKLTNDEWKNLTNKLKKLR